MAKEIDIPLADEAGWEDSLDNREEEDVLIHLCMAAYHNHIT